MTDYRVSHSASDYGRVYDRTYEFGYYRAQWEKVERPLLERLFERYRAEGASRYLDFACGTGRILEVGSRYFPVTYGVDVSDSMLVQARARCPNVTLLRQDLTREPLVERFHLATAFRFFLNAEPELRRDAVAAIWACLEPGGRLLANVHVNRSSVLGLAYRIRNRVKGTTVAKVLGLEELRSVLETRGFVIEETFWYSYLPRPGWRFSRLPALALEPIDAFAKALPRPFQRLAQSFLVVARRPE